MMTTDTFSPTPPAVTEQPISNGDLPTYNEIVCCGNYDSPGPIGPNLGSTGDCGNCNMWCPCDVVQCMFSWMESCCGMVCETMECLCGCFCEGVECLCECFCQILACEGDCGGCDCGGGGCDCGGL